MATMTRAASSASIFEEQQLYFGGSLYSAFNKDIASTFLQYQKNKFEKLIFSRCEYLDTLKTLRHDWISGTSVAPSLDVIEYSKKILIDFSSWLCAKDNSIDIPKLVIGPIPTGGIGIEFIVEGKFKVFLNLYNDSRLELEAQSISDDTYFEVDTVGNSVEFLLKQIYTHLSIQ